MPELPETETIARDLDRLIAGRSTVSCSLMRPDVLRGNFRSTFAAITGEARVHRVFRRAKTVVLELVTAGGPHFLLVTPRFTGALQVGVEPDEYAAVVWSLDDARALVYRDVRRLGTVTLVDRPGYAAYDRVLGVEPLDPGFTGERLSGIVRGSRTPIKKLLMDQRRVAGIGNIYANEALWGVGIDPSRPARSLGADESGRLVAELQRVLRASIAARGTTFRDYRDAQNQRGGFADQLRAYGRGGAPCLRCGTRLLETHAIDGRSTVMCHRCQS